MWIHSFGQRTDHKRQSHAVFNVVVLSPLVSCCEAHVSFQNGSSIQHIFCVYVANNTLKPSTLRSLPRRSGSIQGAVPQDNLKLISALVPQTAGVERSVQRESPRGQKQTKNAADMHSYGTSDQRLRQDAAFKTHSHCASTPTLSVHTTILFPMFDTGNVMLTATLTPAKIETCSILSHGTLPLR